MAQGQAWNLSEPLRNGLNLQPFPSLFQTEIKRTQPRLVNPRATAGAGHISQAERGSSSPDFTALGVAKTAGGRKGGSEGQSVPLPG